MSQLPSTTHPSRPHESATVDWSIFSYLVAEKSWLYRQVVDVFADAKAEFSLHLRSGEVRSALARKGLAVDAEEVESALQQLESWGNLQAYQDHADVASLAEYYRKRLLYQMTAAGEAAYASTLTFVERLGQAAKLDARALERIASAAGQLQRLVREFREHAEIDSAVVLTTARNICQDAEELTARAQSFFRWLHERTAAERGDLEAFLQYKQQLIDYLQQFVGELILRSGEIARHLSDITDDELAMLAQLAAVEDVGLPVAGQEADHEVRILAAAARWRFRIMGLCGWFIRRAGKPPQAEQLRAAARSAIPQLLQLAAQLNERQSGRSDRVADLKTLALHFLACRTDDQAQELFREAFSLAPARHLRVEVETLLQRDQAPISAKTRWADAEPVVIQPQLRATGRAPAAAVNRRVTDRSRDRAALTRRLSLQSRRDDAARETLIALGACRLSDIGALDRDALHLLVQLLERSPPRPGQVVSAIQPLVSRSKDGALQIRMWPIDADERSEAGAGGLASIATSDGELLLANAWLEVQRVR